MAVDNRHLRDNAHPHAKAYIGLDHIGIHRGQPQIGLKPAAAKASTTAEPPAKSRL
jgi:hypothetical protein